jgi:hypothetical protein
VDVNKGDAENIFIRSRLVAQETRRRSDIGKGVGGIAATFAATPPLESVELLISLMMSGVGGAFNPPSHSMRALGFYDINRAHFHAPARRNIYIVPPAGDLSINAGLPNMLRSTYGTRDAAQCFDAFSEDAMRKLGFEIGEYSPCIYSCPERNAICVRHGDDFILLAKRSAQTWFLKALWEHMLTKHLELVAAQGSWGCPGNPMPQSFDSLGTARVS